MVRWSLMRQWSTWTKWLQKLWNVSTWIITCIIKHFECRHFTKIVVLYDIKGFVFVTLGKWHEHRQTKGRASACESACVTWTMILFSSVWYVLPNNPITIVLMDFTAPEQPYTSFRPSVRGKKNCPNILITGEKAEASGRATEKEIPLSGTDRLAVGAERTDYEVIEVKEDTLLVCPISDGSGRNPETTSLSHES